MSEIPLPPGFRELQHERRARRRRRRRTAFAGALAVLLILGVGGWQLWRDRERRDTASAPSPTRTTCAGATPLVVLSSEDKAAAMTRLAADFSAADGCTRVSVVSRPSGTALDLLSADWPTSEGPPPDVWTPSSSSWLALLRETLGSAGRPDLLPLDHPTPSLGSSPSVIALPQPMARALGWPGKSLGWKDVLAIGSSPTGWGAVRHPEWGGLRLGKTDPRVVGDGLDATLAATCAATGSGSAPLTAEQVANTVDQALLARIEQAVFRYEKDPAIFTALWSKAGRRAPEAMSARLTDEQFVAAYNRGVVDRDPLTRSTPPAVPLVAIYPTEGSVVADHPYAVLDGSWVDARKRAAAAAFATYLAGPRATATFRAAGLRTAAGELTDPQATSLGLDPSQPRRVLRRPGPEATQAALQLWQRMSVTARILMVLDVSGSMDQPVAGSGSPVTKLDAAKEVLGMTVGLFSERDQVGLWSFSGGRRGVVDHTEQVPLGPLGQELAGGLRKAVLAQRINNLRAGGDTGLYNTIIAAHRALAPGVEPGSVSRIILITDGRNDAQGGATLAEVLREIQRTPAARRVGIVTIAYGPDADQPTLAAIARASGGTAVVAPRPQDLITVFVQAMNSAI